MSNKVVVTKEQEKALKSYIRENSRKDLLLTHAMKLAEKHHWIVNPELNAFSLQDMADIVIRGFESQQEYEIGDWVTRVAHTGMFFGPRHDGNYVLGSVFKVKSVSTNDIIDENLHAHMFENIRPSTPEEIKIETDKESLANAFKKVGRKPGEFVRGDVGVHRRGNKVLSPTNIINHYKAGNLQGFYPAESLIKFEEGDSYE